jgi:hypothetical protein
VNEREGRKREKARNHDQTQNEADDSSFHDSLRYSCCCISILLVQIMRAAVTLGVHLLHLLYIKTKKIKYILREITVISLK